MGRLATGRGHAESALKAAERSEDPALLVKALGQLLMSSVCTGEPVRAGLLARLSAFEDCTTISTYYQPSAAIGMTLFFAGDGEAARPLLERAVRRALSRGEEWDRLGLLLS